MSSRDTSVMDATFTLEGLPPSINAYWRGAKNHPGTYITEIGRAYSNYVVMKVRSEMNKQQIFFGSFPKEWALAVAVDLYSPGFWLKATKKEPARPSQKGGDADNFLKIILDTTSKALGFDDSQIVHLSVTKHQSEEKKTVVNIRRAA